MSQFDMSTLVNWIVSGFIVFAFGAIGIWVTHRFERKRDDLRWQRESEEMQQREELRWQLETEKMELQFKREKELLESKFQQQMDEHKKKLAAKENRRIRQELIKGLENATVTIAKLEKLDGELKDIPIVGRIQAGLPIPIPSEGLSYYEVEGTVSVPYDMLPISRVGVFALEVKGDSMIDAMVSDGDIIILKVPTGQERPIENGDLVAVWMRDKEEATLKYYFRQGDRVHLQPANPNYDPIFIDDPSNLEIGGRVVMVIRSIDSSTTQRKYRSRF